MNKFYKRFLILIVLVLVISGTVIYTTVDINTLKNLTQFKTWSIALAIFAVSLGLFFDGSRLMHLVKISDEKITLYQAVQVIFGNYFLALLTPGATGGAVAQLMFLRHAGVPTGKAAVLVIVRTLLSILFLVLCMPFIFMHDAGIVPGISNDTLMAITLTAFVVIIAIVVGARRGYLDYLVVRIARHTKKERRCKIIAFYRDTKSAIALLAASPKAMLLVFAESGLNLLCIYAIGLECKSFSVAGCKELDAIQIISVVWKAVNHLYPELVCIVVRGVEDVNHKHCLRLCRAGLRICEAYPASVEFRHGCRLRSIHLVSLAGCEACESGGEGQNFKYCLIHNFKSHLQLTFFYCLCHHIGAVSGSTSGEFLL